MRHEPHKVAAAILALSIWAALVGSIVYDATHVQPSAWVDRPAQCSTDTECMQQHGGDGGPSD
jgi:hypothetical protein